MSNTNERGDVVLTPGARVRYGKVPHTWRWWAVKRSLQLGAAYTVVYAIYNRNTMMEGGLFSRSKGNFLQQDYRLLDWYFHMLGKEGAGFKVSYQYQAAVPYGQKFDADELLTEFARCVMGSWVRTYERRERGLDEPLDRYAEEDLMSCQFRPPSGFEKAIAKESVEPDLPWWRRIFGAGSKPEKKIEEPEFLGDCIGGYFSHRRDGTDNSGARRQLGGATADQISGRSLVLAPDPWEERTYVLSVSPGNGYCTLRLHYATTGTSEFFPEASYFGLLSRHFNIHRNRWLLSSAGRQFERVMRQKVASS
eukprot:TRINITY_DN5852_c0_g1_i1.p1 TRINITY_DN5852_c0_g1~~TRINITY_DN5852_c0_g1_i1.p1  ORF type:complete len:308 (+),score=42.30 TRINITY_DN5852_c0_g1_i1:259-1182(+)